MCWEIIHSLKKSGGYLFHRFLNKKKNKNQKEKVPICHLILGGIFLAAIFICTFFDWKIGLYLFAITLFYYFLIFLFLIPFKFSDKKEGKEEDNSFNLKEEILHLIQIFAIVLCIEVICCFVSVAYTLSNKKDYFIVETNGQVAVVIETYPDYYIMKKARIDGDNLIIMKDSQIVKSTIDTALNKRSFNDIYFE